MLWLYSFSLHCTALHKKPFRKKKYEVPPSGYVTPKIRNAEQLCTSFKPPALRAFWALRISFSRKVLAYHGNPYGPPRQAVAQRIAKEIGHLKLLKLRL